MEPVSHARSDGQNYEMMRCSKYVHRNLVKAPKLLSRNLWKLEMCSRSRYTRMAGLVERQRQQQQRRRLAVAAGIDSTAGIVPVEDLMAAAHFEWSEFVHFAMDVVMLELVAECLHLVGMVTVLGFAEHVVYPESVGRLGSSCNHLLELGKGIDQPCRIEVGRMGRIVGRNVHSMA